MKQYRIYLGAPNNMVVCIGIKLKAKFYDFSMKTLIYLFHNMEVAYFQIDRSWFSLLVVFENYVAGNESVMFFYLYFWFMIKGHSKTMWTIVWAFWLSTYQQYLLTYILTQYRFLELLNLNGDNLAQNGHITPCCPPSFSMPPQAIFKVAS